MSKIKLFRAVINGHLDQRRTITDAVLPSKTPFVVRQIKQIVFTQQAVDRQTPIGNHFHTLESKRYEFFVVMAGKCRFIYRNPKNDPQEVIMNKGDACLIPPGCTHTFIALENDATLWGLSNMAYEDEHSIPDKLA